MQLGIANMWKYYLVHLIVTSNKKLLLKMTNVDCLLTL